MTRVYVRRILLALTLLSTYASSVFAKPTISRSMKNPSTIEVIGLDKANLQALGSAKLSREEWTAMFALYVGTGKRGDRPAMLGTYSVVGEVVRLGSRFPLQQGVRYTAELNPARLPIPRKELGRISKEFFTPLPKVSATEVSAVYPSAKVLPENQLKFYIQFSAPMSRGLAYKNIRLLDSTGKPIADPFLELQEELWDPKVQRFTLLIDPGRIKRGLKPREEIGPVLEEGKKYTLVVDASWNDARGNALAKTFEKPFSVVAPDEQQPDIKTWKLETPSVGTRKPLVVTFPEPLDHAMLQHALWVETPQGEEVQGDIQVRDEETRWVFTPRVAWPSGEYVLLADTTLEDRAGNNLDKPFEIDVFRKVDERIERRQVQRKFQIGN